ncbi:MAG: flagellar type III secretion system pore protein FliP [Thermoguttaceae bacterium]|nr:flagellar type III secretion system pore protein FliP [Thermoguttaceae bacterium]
MRAAAIFLLTLVFSINVAWAQNLDNSESTTRNSQLIGETPRLDRTILPEQENDPVGSAESSRNSEQAPHSSLLTPNSQTSFSFTSLLSPDGVMGSMGTLLTLGVLTLAPALIVMTTSFVRIVVVLGLLRQALGVQNLPPQQVITGLALFITFFVMYPVGSAIYNDALKPYEAGQITAMQAWDTGVVPLRQFMSRQIQKAGNDADVWLFWRADPDAPAGDAAQNLTYDDVPLRVLVPAFMTSELKIAFLMGVKLFIPFLIIDFLVSAITVSMGIMTLPPVMISLPLKLLLFVMLDGWRLTVEMLLTSFG